MSDIQSFPAADLARKTGDILDAASRAPVAITKHRKPRFVLMSLECHEAVKDGSGQQAHTLDDIPADLTAMMIVASGRDLAKSGARDAQAQRPLFQALRAWFFDETREFRT